MAEPDQKVQLNLRVNAVLARQLRIEAAQMGMRVSEYAVLLLERRNQLLKETANV